MIDLVDIITSFLLQDKLGLPTIKSSMIRGKLDKAQEVDDVCSVVDKQMMSDKIRVMLRSGQSTRWLVSGITS